MHTHTFIRSEPKHRNTRIAVGRTFRKHMDPFQAQPMTQHGGNTAVFPFPRYRTFYINLGCGAFYSDLS
jgi:hypothetical protein